MRALNAGGGAAKLVVKCCAEGACVAFDGKAWAIVVLANVHRDKLFGAIGYQRACGIGGLIVGEMSFCRQDAFLKKARIVSLTQHCYIVIAFERENATVLERIDGMLRQLACVGGKANRITLSIKPVADGVDDVVGCRIRLNADSGNREGVTWVEFLNRQMCEAFF